MARKFHAPRGTYNPASPRISRAGKAFSLRHGASLGPFDRCRRCHYGTGPDAIRGYHPSCLEQTALEHDCEPQDIDMTVHPATQKQIQYAHDLIARYEGMYTPSGRLLHMDLLRGIDKKNCSALIDEILGKR